MKHAHQTVVVMVSILQHTEKYVIGMYHPSELKNMLKLTDTGLDTDDEDV